MYKVGLIGGFDIRRYTVADKLWALISEYTDINFNFEIFPLHDKLKLDHFFYNTYLKDENFIGFNVALPWKSEISARVDKNLIQESLYDISISNTVFKRDNLIFGTNTDILGVYRSFSSVNIPNHGGKKTVLILGSGGAGYPTAIFLSRLPAFKIYIYDNNVFHEDKYSITRHNSLKDLKKIKYDLIINATPLGKLYLDSPVQEFASPLDLFILKEIIYDNTILQEMNYFPYNTFFLQLGNCLGLETIHGLDMLIHQALGSFSYYFNTEFPSNQFNSLKNKMMEILEKMEIDLL